MLAGYPLEIAITTANSAAQAWYGYDQGVISGILISPNFIKTFPQTKDSNIQGITASCFSLGNLLGCLLTALFGEKLGRKNTLRVGALLSTIGAILQFSAYSFPQLIFGRVLNGVGNESPRWLLNHDRVEDAQEALRRLLGSDLSSDDPIVQNELKSILGAIEIERRSHISFKEVILRRDRSGHFKRLLLGCGGQFIQQWGGINALNYYFPIILTKSLGLSTLLARILTGANATSYMISSALAFWLIERTGRRSLMMTGLGLQGFAYVMVALSVGLLITNPHGWGSTAITFLFFYYAAFGCTWGMVPWVYQAEINSLAMRTRGAAAATATNWLFGFVCTQFTPTAIKNIGYRFYIIFAALNLLFLPVVYFLYPETMQRTLEDLDWYFDIDSPHKTFIPFGDKVAKQRTRPTEFIEAEAERIAVGKDTAESKGFTTHVESVSSEL
ncbi:hypothetical protein P7C71_g5951, partial [Lecanoromycetidae sp. Uapishka_2]